jgi:uncharacterized protein (DUF1800 family)
MVQAAPLGEDDARHLLNRTGFGATGEEVAHFARLSRTEAVDTLLQEARTTPQTPAPDWVGEAAFPRRGFQQATAEAKQAAQQQQRERGASLRAWWYDEMLNTPSPLTEWMTLFWHNHFTSSLRKTRSPVLMYRQNLLLRREALGNFATLLHAITRDPAMLVYLDGVRNVRGQPNENYAREVMELFTLGEGHYSERDVREAARALTGLSLDRERGEFVFRPALFDAGEKTIFGQRGRFDADGFIDLLLARPETAEFITRKLWRSLISPTPDEALVRRWAKTFRDQGYEIKPLLRAMLTSDAFYAPAARGVLVKSPVELTIGTARCFVPPARRVPGTIDWRPMLVVNATLGQDIFNPPNVKGWPGGEDWINTQSLLTRKQWLAKVFRAEDVIETLAVPPTAPMRGGEAAEQTPDASERKLRRTEKRMARLDEQWGRGFYFDQWLAQNGGPARVAKLLLPLPVELPEGGAAELLARLTQHPLYQLK